MIKIKNSIINIIISIINILINIFVCILGITLYSELEKIIFVSIELLGIIYLALSIYSLTKKQKIPKLLYLIQYLLLSIAVYYVFNSTNFYSDIYINSIFYSIIIMLIVLTAILGIMMSNFKNKVINVFSKLIIISLLMIIGYKFTLYQVENVKIYSRCKENFKLVKQGNTYSKRESYEYFQILNKNIVKDKKDIYNAIYTLMDSGYNKFEVICSNEYKNCLSDIDEIYNNFDIISSIIGFVDVRNQYFVLKLTPLTNQTIYLELEDKKYSDEQILKINEQINKIFNELYDGDKSINDNIKMFHDYIINNTEIDDDNKYNNAYSLLFNGKSNSEGYSDTMSLFLDKLNVDNIEIRTDKNVWNYVYVDNNWYHLDVTWDEPLSENNQILYNYFLISDNELKQISDKYHIYNESLYNYFR